MEPVLDGRTDRWWGVSSPRAGTSVSARYPLAKSSGELRKPGHALGVVAAHAQLDSVRDLVVERMETAVELAVPVVAEAGVGKSWYDAKA